jgi:hypothetical protein
MPAEGCVRVAVPVSVRRREEFGTPGNRVPLWLLPLPVAERDPDARLACIRAVTQEVKRRGDASTTELITQAADWTGVDRGAGGAGEPAWEPARPADEVDVISSDGPGFVT